MARALKLLLLIAVLLMPIGMQPAAAAPSQHHSAMPMPQCPDQAPRHDMKGGFAACTMACSAALPAADLPNEHPAIIVCAPTETAGVKILHGLHPETRAPPPKRS